jgi:acylphosphatase
MSAPQPHHSRSSSAPQRVTAHYSGRVQGIGFRATVRRLACGYDVTGQIRNLPDGRVELIAEGAKSELESFLQGIAESSLSGFITQRHDHWAPAQGLRGFTITH